MEQIIIHGSPKREWYINEFLVPSLYQQGFKQEQINIYMDTNHLGNLHATLDCFQNTPTTAWHLQDDVLISSMFKQIIDAYANDIESIICGFASTFDKYQNQLGKVPIYKAWFSFPCIKIPKNILKSFLLWYKQDFSKRNNLQYKQWIKANRYDDSIFHLYLEELNQEKKEMKAIHLYPNIVEHIDQLIGGSVAGPKRKNITIKSVHWQENDLVKQLADRLRARPQ